MQTVTNTSDLASSLNVSASAALTTIRGGGSAEAKFLQQRQVNTYYTYSLVKVYVENPAKLIRNVTLKEEAIRRLKNGGWEEFSQIYGKQYVEGYITGGTYYALIEVQTTNAEEKREISAKLSGRYSGVGVKVEGSGEAQSKMREATENRTTNVYVFQGGGSGDALEVTMEEMIKQALDFPKLVKEAPVPIRAIVNDYKSIENVPSIPLVPSKQRSVLESLGRSYMKLRDYKAKLEFVSGNIGSFGEYKDLSQSAKRQKTEELNTHRDRVLDAMQLIADSADECVDDSKQCKIPPLSDDLFTSIPLPEGLTTDLPTRINGTSVTVPTNSSTEKLQEYDIRNQDSFEVEVKLSIPLSETKSPGAARFIGLGISSTKSGKTISIKSGTNDKGRLLVAEASGDANKTAYRSPGEVVYFKITKQTDEFNLLWSRDGLSFETLIKDRLTNLGFSVDDTYKVFLGGYSSDSRLISGKFSDLTIT